MVVRPEKVLPPVRTCVPLPLLASDTVPNPLAIVPPKVLRPETWLTVSVGVAADEFCQRRAAGARQAADGEFTPSRSRTPLFRLAVPVPRAEALPTASVPPLMVVPPV